MIHRRTNYTLIKKVIWENGNRISTKDLIKKLLIEDANFFNGATLPQAMWNMMRVVTPGYTIYSGVHFFNNEKISREAFWSVNLDYDSSYQDDSQKILNNQTFVSNYEFPKPLKKGKINISQEENKSFEHSSIIYDISMYAKLNNLPFNFEYIIENNAEMPNKRIDIFYKWKNEYYIVEVKSGDNWFYEALGQLLTYNFIFNNSYHSTEKCNMIIISNVRLTNGELCILDAYKIKYVNYEEYKTKLWCEE